MFIVSSDFGGINIQNPQLLRLPPENDLDGVAVCDMGAKMEVWSGCRAVLVPRKLSGEIREQTGQQDDG